MVYFSKDKEFVKTIKDQNCSKLLDKPFHAVLYVNIFLPVIVENGLYVGTDKTFTA